MDTNPCLHCGKPVSAQALRCPHCGAPGPKAKANSSAALTGCGLSLLVALGFCAYVASDIGSNSTPAPPATEAPVVESGRWEEVAAVVRGSGATVEPFDPSAPRTMRILLPAGMDPTPADARRLAVTTRDRLGPDAIVYVKESTGHTLAKAAPWGVE